MDKQTSSSDDDAAELDRLISASSIGAAAPRRLRRRASQQDVHIALDYGHGFADLKDNLPTPGVVTTEHGQQAEEIFVITNADASGTSTPPGEHGFTRRIRRASRFGPTMTSALATLAIIGLFTIGIAGLPYRYNDTFSAVVGLTPITAAIPVPVPTGSDSSSPRDYWLFFGDHYGRVRISSSGHPFQERSNKTLSLREVDAFKNLPEFRNKMDAALPVPGNGHDYWVFSGLQYIKIRVVDNGGSFDAKLMTGPRPLSDWENAFGSLVNVGVEAVMPTPDDPRQYWVFGGDTYVRTVLDNEGPGGHVNIENLIDYGWPGTLSRFTSARGRVDAVLQVPGNRNDYWAFSDTRYMKIRVADKTYDDTVILEGPTSLLFP